MKFAFPYLFKKEIKIENEEVIYRIRLLKERLIAIGYNPGEVEYMIVSCSDGHNLRRMDADQLSQIEEALQEQLDLAQKCKEFIEFNVKSSAETSG